MPARSVRLVQPEDLLRLVTVADPQISPDGEQVAFIRKVVGAKHAREVSIWLVDAGAAPTDSLDRAIAARAAGSAAGRPKTARASNAVPSPGRSTQLTQGPRDSHPRWSPDGSSLLFVRAKEKTKPQLALVQIAQSKSGKRGSRARKSAASLPTARTLTKLPEGSMSEIAWSPDGTRVAFKWRPTLEQFTSDAANARKKTGASIPPLVVDDPWYRLDGDGYFGSARYALHVLDLTAAARKSARGKGRAAKSGRATGAAREVFACPHLDDFTFDWSPDGRTIAVACNRDSAPLFHPERAEIVLVDAVGRQPVRAIAGMPEGPKDSPRWSPDGTRLAWAGRRGRSAMYDTANVELWSAEVGGSASRPRAVSARSLTAGTDYCLMVGTLSDTADASFAPWFRWSPDGRSLMMRIGWHGAGRIASVDSRGGAVQLHTSGDADIMPGSMAAHGHRLACTRSGPALPPEIVIAEVLGRDFLVHARTDFNHAFAQQRLLAVPTEHWVSASGTDSAHRNGRGGRSGDTSDRDRAHPGCVHTWVMRPPRGAPSRKGAAVLEIHGGPHAQYGNAFFHEFQVLAAQGYTVVYSNPRGSKGYGAKFCGAIKGAWGTADWKDVQSVTAFMRTIRGVQSARLGIMGGSYGGYMTNWAIAHSREYRAAITDRCVSDLVSMCGSSDYPEVPDLYWRGVSWDRPEALWRSSPIAYFKGVSTPTLIIHSEGDLRCNIEQGEQVHAALVAQGVPCRFVRYPRETSHGMSRVGPADLRIHRLHEILEWWSNHLQ